MCFTCGCTYIKFPLWNNKDQGRFDFSLPLRDAGGDRAAADSYRGDRRVAHVSTSQKPRTVWCRNQLKDLRVLSAQIQTLRCLVSSDFSSFRLLETV